MPRNHAYEPEGDHVTLDKARSEVAAAALDIEQDIALCREAEEILGALLLKYTVVLFGDEFHTEKVVGLLGALRLRLDLLYERTK